MRILGPAVFALACASFFLFSYNSGYGYDALENLVIGRSLLDGYAHYDFIPSRSFGMYSLVAAALAVTKLDGHVFSSAFVTALFAAYVAATHWVVRRSFDRTTAWIAASLVALAAAFMEMNFLIAEGPLLLAALFGYDAMLKPSARPALADLWAGFLFGVGLAFKTVAVFYVFGACACVVVAGLLARTLLASVARAVRIGLGALLWIIGPAAYFAAVGRLHEHLEWTYVFPALHYPSNTAYLGKLLIKTSFFIVLFAAALVGSAGSKRLRPLVYRNHAAVLALVLGLAAALALLKQQASHYMFPAAGFLAIFIAHVARTWLGEHAVSMRAVGSFAAVAALAATSLVLYRPSALERFTKIADYSHEQPVAEAIRARVPPGRSPFFLEDSLILYWIAHRYPESSFLKIDVQELYVMAREPDVLDRVFASPRLALVSFDPKSGLGVSDGRFNEAAAAPLARIRAVVERRFERALIFAGYDVFWTPR